jgi:hypothetical protein
MTDVRVAHHADQIAAGLERPECAPLLDTFDGRYGPASRSLARSSILVVLADLAEFLNGQRHEEVPLDVVVNVCDRIRGWQEVLKTNQKAGT